MKDESDAHPGYGDLYANSFKNNPEQEIRSLREPTLECIDNFDIDELDQDSQYLMSPNESTQLFIYFTMVAAVAEELSIALLAKVLTDTETSSEKSSTQFFDEKFNQKRRENLLFHTGIVGSGTKGEMKELRDHRNTIVHDHRERKLVHDLDDIKDKVNGGVRVTEQLWGKLQNVQ